MTKQDMKRSTATFNRVGTSIVIETFKCVIAGGTEDLRRTETRSPESLDIYTRIFLLPETLPAHSGFLLANGTASLFNLIFIFMSHVAVSRATKEMCVNGAKTWSKKRRSKSFTTVFARHVFFSSIYKPVKVGTVDAKNKAACISCYCCYTYTSRTS